jgi:hypothetical protein
MKRFSLVCAAVLVITACSSDKTTSPNHGFLSGQVALVVNSTGRTLTLFQTASTTTQETVQLGASGTITAVDASIRGTNAMVPLGDAASGALVNLSKPAITRYFIYPSGFATGSAWVDDTTILVDNTGGGAVGRMTMNQTSDTISDTVVVTPQPTAIVMVNGMAYVVSANLDAGGNSIGPGVLTEINPNTMAIVGTLTLPLTNSSAAALGPDGNLYVLNTGDFTNPGSMSVVNPATLTITRNVTNMIVGPGSIYIDANGLAYISGFYTGTVIYNTATQSYVRGPSNPLCAPLPNNGGCRGAFDAETDSKGNVYQVFFGSSAMGNTPAYPGQVFVYAAGTYALTDSVAVGQGPAAIRIASF